MRLRSLGSTGLRVSLVGLGLAALGRPAYIDLGRGADLGPDRGVEALERRCHQVLDAPRRRGPLPGRGPLLRPGRGVLGQPARGQGLTLPRSPSAPSGATPTSATGAWTPTSTRSRTTLAALTRQLDESRALLGGHLDLYQVHSATLDSGVLEDRAVLDALARLRDDGVVVGLSSRARPGRHHPPRPGAQRRRDGPVRLRAGDLEPAGAVRRFRPGRGERGRLGVIVKEAVANGRLTPHGGGPEAAVLGRVAARHGVGVDAVALAAVLANPWADVVLSGAVTLAQLEANLAAVRVEPRPGELEELAALARPPERYWKERSALSWLERRRRAPGRPSAARREVGHRAALGQGGHPVPQPDGAAGQGGRTPPGAGRSGSTPRAGRSGSWGWWRGSRPGCPPGPPRTRPGCPRRPRGSGAGRRRRRS